MNLKLAKKISVDSRDELKIGRNFFGGQPGSNFFSVDSRVKKFRWTAGMKFFEKFSVDSRDKKFSVDSRDEKISVDSRDEPKNIDGHPG